MVFKTIFDKVITPKGKKGEYSFIKVNDGAFILPIDQDNKVYLIKEFRYPIQGYNIQLIGGGVDNKETPTEAAKRELKEETGIVAKEWINFGSLQINPPTSNHTNHYFIAKQLTFKDHEQGDGEDIELLKVPFDQAIKWCMNGTINNCETIAILFKVREWLKDN